MALATGLPWPLAQNVKCDDESLIVEVVDGRAISVPLIWFPLLVEANAEQRMNWELLGDGEGVHVSVHA